MDGCKPGAEAWQSLECIQSCIKAKVGLGRHIPIHFRLELDIAQEQNISTQFMDKTSTLKQYPPIVKYNFQKIGQEYQKQVTEQSKDLQLEPKEMEQRIDKLLIEYCPQDYCLKQVLKMCHYVSAVRKMEILQMKADFYIDANEKVWFFYAKDIVWRHRKQSVFEIQQIQNAQKEIEDKFHK